jgi:flagellar basal body-associated protein FliL
MLNILSVSLGMRLREVTPDSAAKGSGDDQYPVLHIVLPILIVLALLAISLAILYAFFKNFKQKSEAGAKETN